jgi:hypothetical protein
LIIHLAIFGCGFLFRLGGLEIAECKHNIFHAALYWRGIYWPRIAIQLAAIDDGGLEFLVRRKSKVQGWRLRGPVQHFEY